MPLNIWLIKFPFLIGFIFLFHRFHYSFISITLTLNNIKATAAILTEIFGYKLIDQDVNRYRYATDAVESAAIVDLVELTDEKRGHVANGSVHHVAFRVQNDEILILNS